MLKHLSRSSEKQAYTTSDTLLPKSPRKVGCHRRLREILPAWRLCLTEKRIDHKQTRPYLTVKPLADSLGPDVPFNYDIDRDHVKKVADAVQDFRGPGNILICWEHDTLRKIAKEIGVKDPPKYPGDR